MDTTTRVGTAVAAGYLFGRFKKLRLAMMVGTALASEDARKSALGFMQHGVGGLTTGGAGKIAGTASSKLVDAGRGAAIAAAAARLEKITDRLAERTDALNGVSRQEDDEASDEPEDEYEEDGAEEDEESPEEPEDEYDEGEEAEDEYEEEGAEEEDEESPEEPEDEYEEEDEEDEEPEPAPARSRRRPARVSAATRTRARRTRALAPAGGR